MRTAQSLQRRSAQAQRISPRLVAAGAILEMSTEELQLRLEEEISLNPALEVVWDSVCQTCGRGLIDGNCWHCQRTADSDTESVNPYDDLPLPRQPSRDEWEGGYDPLENVRTPITLREYVTFQARLVVSASEIAIADYLIATLNDDGLLESAPEEAAEALDISPSRVSCVLSLLQTLDPPGICARSVQESVLIQVREASFGSPVPALVEPILSRHWHDLANHAYGKIARSLRASPERVEEAVTFIRDNLHPYPGRLYHPPHTDARKSSGGGVRPDVFIQRDDADYLVEVARPYDFELRVSEAYRRIEAEARRGNGDSPEQQIAIEQCRRANWLLQCLALREQTLRQIAEYVAVFQRSFLDTQSEGKMKPLTRTQVAQRIGKHPSTVSRAISGKFVLLPNGNLIPFDRLFSTAAGPKTVVAELLLKENPDRPLTDEQICRILRVRGFQVARRTVTKYRLALRLPSSAQRGRH